VLKIEELTIDDHILDKIESKHGVGYDEVRETCLSGAHYARRTRDGLYELFGRTAAGRYMAVLLANRGGGLWKIVSAREMTERERRLYGKATGNK
jgi:uncharacterized DUF497 family protein